MSRYYRLKHNSRVSLREQPEAQAIPTGKLDIEESLSKLSPHEQATLEKRARTILEETTNPFLIILPMVHAKMLELHETDLMQEEEVKDDEDEGSEEEEVKDDED